MYDCMRVWLTVSLFDCKYMTVLTDIWLSDYLDVCCIVEWLIYTTVWLVWKWGYMTVWHDGFMTVLLFDSMNVWLINCVNVWVSDCLIIWIVNCMSVWLSRYVTVCLYLCLTVNVWLFYWLHYYNSIIIYCIIEWLCCPAHLW